MKKYFLNFIILGAITTLGQQAFAQEKEYFQSDVETAKKPWTNKAFYNDPANFQFAIVSDNTGGERLGVFDDAVRKLNMVLPEFVLSVGDLIEGYTTDTVSIGSQWDNFNDKVNKLNMPFFYLPGNHDITNKVMSNEWEKRFGRRYYQFTYKDVLFVILDSNDDHDHNLTDQQTAFAIEAIQSNAQARWIFVLMHHPIWKYDTEGRFQKIEETLKGRNFTVIAGHEHTYQHAERNTSNYYVLSTTGGFNQLRGNHFGEFDHFVWVTMTENGPVMANLRLDGILSHDIANASTKPMAESMLANTAFRYMILTNPGDQFHDATAYLSFRNTAKTTLNVKLVFYHHHQLDISPALQDVEVKPGEEKVVEINLIAHDSISYADLGFLRYYWKLSYEGEEYRDFLLDGNSDCSILPGVPDYFKPSMPQFISSANVLVQHPYKQLMTIISTDGSIAVPVEVPYNTQIEKTTEFTATLKNDKSQQSATATVTYKSLAYQKGKKIRKVTPGLDVAYYEGSWSTLPDFQNLKSINVATAEDFSFEKIADKEDNFCLRYTGYFEVKEPGLHFFRIVADDAAVLSINGLPVCGHQSGELNIPDGLQQDGGVALSVGMHPVIIDYAETLGAERLSVYFRRSETEVWQSLRANNFFRATPMK